jgi:hypothetical protein
MLDIKCRRWTLFRDQEIRSEIYDAIQGVLNRYDLLILPACRSTMRTTVTPWGRSDADVLAASAVFERLRPWQDTYRICSQRTI